MEDKIRLTVELICKIDKIVRLYHQQREYEAAGETKQIIQKLSEQADVIYAIFREIDEPEGMVSFSCFSKILERIYQAQKNMDNILLADLLDTQLKDIFSQVLERFNKHWNRNIFYMNQNCDALKVHHEELLSCIKTAEPKGKTEYYLEPCNDGGITLRLEEDGNSYYLCSKISPQKAARELSAFYCRSSLKKYILWGFELGYIAEAILEEEPYTKLCVIEQDPYIVKLAIKNRDLTSLFSNSRFSLKLETDKEVIESINERGQELLVHAPSIRHIQDSKLKEALENYYIHFSSVKEHERLLMDNFTTNQKLLFSNIAELRNKFENKKMIYIGGGPSLDKVIHILMKMRNRYIIVCAGTVAGKLMRECIVPEYVIIIDGQPSMSDQIIHNVNVEETSLLFLSTASKDAVKAFRGKRYIIYQSGFPLSEDAAAEENIMLFETGGSVSTTALDIGLRFGCNSIVCFGLDLAYTDNLSHAKDTIGSRQIPENNRMRWVEGITGKSVMTAKNLDVYRRWIEQRISLIRKTELINVSDGAVIHGMKNIACEDFIQQYSIKDEIGGADK